jgi:glycosyltransferase involved in cell wall biosynthesis
VSDLTVVHVIDSLAGSGGAENRLVDEVVALAERGGVDQTAVRLYERADLAPRLADAGVPVVALGFHGRTAGRTWPLAARRLRAVLAQRRPDVVHTALFSGNLVGQLAAHPLGLPVVSTFNRTGDLALQRALQPGVASWRGRTMQALARWSAGRDDVHFRAVSADARATNCRLLRIPPERATVVPRGIALDPVLAAGAGADRAALGLPAGPLVINVARLVPEKAQHLLVEAFAHARGALPGAQLVVAGAPGPAEGLVRTAVARHGLGDAVHLLGHRPDARALVAAADVFAFSSLSEGSPGAVLEALALGTPVAAFAIPPVVELTADGRHAHLAPVGDAAALGDAIVAAATAPDRAGAAAAARAWAAGFGLPAVADRLADLLGSRARAGVGTR